MIQQFIPDRDRDDRMIWRHSGSMIYPTKSIGVKILEGQATILPKPVTNLVWQKFIPPRAQVSVWLANLERLKTGDFLLNKGMIEAQWATCPFYNTTTESNSHILLTCNFSWSTWMEILKWWGISAALQNRCSKFSMEWMGLIKRRKNKKLWGLVLGCVIWSLWYERNKIKFNRRTINWHKFLNSQEIRIGIWAKEMMGLTVIPSHGVIGNSEFGLKAVFFVFVELVCKVIICL